jgi:hypothetical protein
MSRHLIAALLLACFACHGQVGGAATSVDRAKIAALSQMLLRDSAELPLDVAVTTVLTDPAGKEKRRSQSSAHLLFHGYNREADRFSFVANSGWFASGALRDSLSGDYAVFEAFSRFAPKMDGGTAFETRQQQRPGQALLVSAPGPDCHDFSMGEGVLYPHKHCSSVEFRVGSDSTGSPTVEGFSLEILNLPAPAKIPYLGAVQIRGIHAEGDIQKSHLPNDPQPFFIPRRVTTSIVTDKGTIALTNAYTLKASPVRKK